ncbi:kinase-like domain-containing protein [Chytridium lagenaria]|nr:kinase-like domain-containing protein [Chytridium lagenaria]
MGNSSAKLASGEDVEVDLRQFNLLRCVGKGAFGKVRIVEKRDTRKLYALKYINKQQCVRMRAIQNIFRERAILEELSHPYIVNLRYAFQDDDNMFMVLDLMMGGDLRYHLDRIGGFREDAVRIMATELSSALNYLHKSKIVHRDLKPDNRVILLFLFFRHTNLTIIFQHCREIRWPKRIKIAFRNTRIHGPEIFGDSGYLWQVDWWSLGVCLYECLYGKRPFRGNSNEALTNAIRKQTLTLPDANYVTRQTVGLSNEGANFIRGLLDRNVERRLGSMGFESIRGHPWISGFDWERVERKDMNPLFVPEPNRSNFDASYDLEELLLEENPLKYKPRKRNQKPTPPFPPPTPHHPRQQRKKLRLATVSFQAAEKRPPPLLKMVPTPCGGGGFFNMLMSQPAGGASAHGNAAKDRVTAELQFIEENFKTYDFTLAAKAKRAAAVVAAAAAASAAAESHALTMDPASPSNLSSAFPPLLSRNTFSVQLPLVPETPTVKPEHELPAKSTQMQRWVDYRHHQGPRDSRSGEDGTGTVMRELG